MFNRTYAHIVEETGETYLLRIASDLEGDWTIEVYNQGGIEILNVLDIHSFFDVPEELHVPILLDIKRGQRNISANKTNLIKKNQSQKR